MYGSATALLKLLVATGGSPWAGGSGPEPAGTLRRLTTVQFSVTLLRFVEELPPTDRRLLVLNRTEPRQVTELLKATFPEEDVPIQEDTVEDAQENEVLLVDQEDLLARSSLESLEEQLLFVNSDIYRTGSIDLADVSLPDVLLDMEEVPFHLRGYPESDREKLVLIAVSRLIERRALDAGDGTLRSSFQQLSRIEDERGTRDVYDTVADTDVDVHLYGVPDELPARDLGTVVHAGHTEDFRHGWFVLFDPPAAGPDPIGLVAYEVDPRQWRGFWTTDPDRFRRIRRYVERTL